MNILQVVHSFLPYTMAGTEVYSYTLSKELSKKNKVFVFFRIKNTAEKEYFLNRSNFDGLETYAVNKTFKFCNSFEETFNDAAIDEKFRMVLDEVSPDIVHIHHLLFLSHGIVREIKKRNIPIAYTLHDYWLMCYRGQLVKEDLSLCESGPCPECLFCLRYLLGIKKYSLYLYSFLRVWLSPAGINVLKKVYLLFKNRKFANEFEIWKRSLRDIRMKIDLFIAPSYFIKNKFSKFGIQDDRIVYLPYGFDHKNHMVNKKTKSYKIRFGFMGTLLPVKGLDVLISAFKKVYGDGAVLSIYGKLFAYSGFESYPEKLRKDSIEDTRIKLKGGYDHKDISDILADIDVLVVPSVWQENAPLVIQEAFLSKTPVIASKIGGIPELISHGENGLLFEPGDINDLQSKMQYILDNPNIIDEFQDNIPKIKSIEENAAELEEIYNKLIVRDKL